MTELNRLYATTSLSGPVPTKGLPSPETTGPQALEAAKRIRRFMADAGVTSSDDLAMLFLALLCAVSAREGCDYEALACSLTPTMVDVFKGCGTGGSRQKPRDLLDLKRVLSADEASQMATVLSIALSAEASAMGFAPHRWLEACTWILFALLVSDLGLELARRRFLVLVLI